MLGWMKRFWVVVVIVIALVAAVGVVSRLRTFFDSDKPHIGASQPADAIKPINTKRVTYRSSARRTLPAGSAISTSTARRSRRASPSCRGR